MTLISPHDPPFSSRTIEDLSSLRELRRQDKLAMIKKPRQRVAKKGDKKKATTRKKRQPQLSLEVQENLKKLPLEIQEQMKQQLLAAMQR